MEKEFFTSLDATEMSYLIKMGLFTSHATEDETLETETNLFEQVEEMNNGLESSLRATLTLYRKICLKLVQKNATQSNPQISTNYKQEKRMQKKDGQENSNGDDVISSKLLQIVMWLESKFHAKY